MHIYGFGNRFPSYHFLINLNTKEEKIFISEKTWSDELQLLGVDSKEVLDVFGVFDEFKKNNTLPWK
jgi:hypothetical protein